MKASKKNRFQIGWVVFLGLALLTAIEFVISSQVTNPLIYLVITALVKAALIVYYFMHIRQILQREAEH